MRLFVFLICVGIASAGRYKRPCRRANVVDCLCKDGNTYTGEQEVKENCKPPENKIRFCNCDDGLKWVPRRKPCAEANIVNCVCNDNKTYSGEDEVRRNCKRKENPIQSCNCDDGFPWKPPRKPCGLKENIEECVCEDGETYVGGDVVKENCGRKNPFDVDHNRPKVCTCKDGSNWTPPEKPCLGKKNIDQCTCKDGKTCNDKETCRESCNKRKNPIEACTCLDGTTWERKNEL